MKQILGVLITTIFIVSCSENFKAKYDKKLANFKTEKQALIKEKYNQLLSFGDDINAVDSVYDAGFHKDITIEFNDPVKSNKFNSIYLDYSFFDESYPFQLSNRNNLNDIKNLVEDKPLDLYDEASALLSIEYLNDFIKYANQFLEVETVVIHMPLEYLMPQYTNDGSFTMGEVTGLVCIYDFSTKELLDNFIYVAQSSESIDFIQNVDESAEQVVTSDFFSNVNTMIINELRFRYQMDDLSFIPLLQANQIQK